MDVKRAADLYSQGWTLRQIGAELGVTATTVSEQLRRAGVTMRRGGASAHPASTQQILELRDQGLTWPEIAEQVDMTVSGAWSRYRRARPPKSPRLGRWQQVLADALDENLAIGVRAAVADHLGRAPTRAASVKSRGDRFESDAELRLWLTEDGVRFDTDSLSVALRQLERLGRIKRPIVEHSWAHVPLPGTYIEPRIYSE